jgi:hypothetical protein
MKNINIIIPVFSILVVSCSSNVPVDTKVRLKEISYSQPVPIDNESIPLQASKRSQVDSQYLFDGDQLIFTVEIEDPEYEFISLLSITLNETLIRGNVNNSIASTRDCGLNICIDFPFTIDKSTSTYEVREIKFSKVGYVGAVNANIDETSDFIITLDIYQDDLAPHVNSSILTLNNAIKEYTYLEDNSYLSVDEWNELMDFNFNGRLFFITGYTIVGNEVGVEINGTGIYNQNENGVNEEEIDWFNASGVGAGRQQSIGLGYYGMSLGNGKMVNGPLLHNGFIEPKYKDIYFYNQGNRMYVNVLGLEYFVVEFVGNMKINQYNPDTYN